ncbi:hypothetical protein Ahy_B09g099011 isoform A [Arachis hypogaea]|uniref:Legume lectin domain-containing protein n=1 Tax=Arachis hypogaea TaxID=3818 RepID=A0A444XTI8_ARAHY|nr:hypothetical protein Ahy_B09g099011 isoform A [Arachis hypogaea]
MGVSFNLHKFDPKHSKEIQFQGDATITDHHIIRLTNLDDDGNPLGNRVGRVLFSDPVHLYDHSGLRAGFETTFVFRISKPYNTEYTPGPGDGLAFFLASADTEIPPESSGKFLGLFNDASDRIVAVEFDTFSNSDIGDPNYPHIGIDVNSIRSSKVCYWNFHDAAITTAKITYNSAHKKLTVHVSTYLHSQPDTLTYDVDLSTKLPEKVKIGISASTGQFSQTTEILSWIFKSLASHFISKNHKIIAMGVSFNLHKFDPKHSKEIQFQGDATITDHHIIRLTNLDDDGNPLGNRVGRVLFSDPVHLYDHSGLRAGFETTFVIKTITTAKITYNSAYKKLTVHVSTYLHSQPDTLTYDVDLSTKLPEKVKIGISASTGQFSQTTEILSWIFKQDCPLLLFVFGFGFLSYVIYAWMLTLFSSFLPLFLPSVFSKAMHVKNNDLSNIFCILFLLIITCYTTY